MRFFYYSNPQTRGPEHDTRIIESTVDLALQADRSGFAAIALTEHHFTNYNTYGNAFMMGSYLAPQLTQAHIILAVTVPATQNPLELAERANLLDQLSKGRAIIGVGPGSSPVEFEGLGRDYEGRYGALDDALTIVEQAWGMQQDAEPLSYRTAADHGTVVGRVMPSPYGGKAKPRLARATLSDNGFRWAGERGLPVFFGRYPAGQVHEKLDIYSGAMRDAGYSEADVAEALRWSFAQKMIYVAESDEQAAADLLEPVRFYQSIIQRAFGSRTGHVGEGIDVRKALGAAAGEPEEFLRAAAIIGSPSSVIEQIEELADAGLPNLACWMYFGDMPMEKVQRSMDLFTDKVMPRFNVAAGASR